MLPPSRANTDPAVTDRVITKLDIIIVLSSGIAVTISSFEI
jgi:hypothetical protein